MKKTNETTCSHTPISHASPVLKVSCIEGISDDSLRDLARRQLAELDRISLLNKEMTAVFHDTCKEMLRRWGPV